MAGLVLLWYFHAQLSSLFQRKKYINTLIFNKGTLIYIDFCKLKYDDAFKELMRQVKLKSQEASLKEASKKVGAHSNPTRVPAENQTLSSDIHPTAASMSSTALNPGSALNQLEQETKQLPKHPVQSWDSNQVDKWFSEQKVDKHIVKHLSPCKGENLYQYYMLQTHSPEFYYQMVKNIDGMTDPRSFNRFSTALKELFE